MNTLEFEGQFIVDQIVGRTCWLCYQPINVDTRQPLEYRMWTGETLPVWICTECSQRREDHQRWLRSLIPPGPPTHRVTKRQAFFESVKPNPHVGYSLDGHFALQPVGEAVVIVYQREYVLGGGSPRIDYLVYAQQLNGWAWVAEWHSEVLPELPVQPVQLKMF